MMLSRSIRCLKLVKPLDVKFCSSVKLPESIVVKAKQDENDKSLKTFDMVKGFGALADTKSVSSEQKYLGPSKFKLEEELEDHDGESEHFAKVSDTSRPYPRDYEKKIANLLSKRQLAKALKVFDEDMKDDLVKPNVQTYKLLIYACGKAGHAARAAQLLRHFESKRLVSETSFDMYANVFHACVNGPPETKEACLKTAYYIKGKLDRKFQRPLTPVLYNTMIAAFGRCGDLDQAFAIMDEMNTKGALIDETTFHHLLQGCIADKQNGFRLSLAVYRQMLKTKRCEPDTFTFNLLLRAVKECGVGDPNLVNDLLMEAMSSKDVRQFKQKLLEDDRKLLAEPKLDKNGVENPGTGEPSSKVTIVNAKTEIALVPPQLPNLLSRKPVMEFISGLTGNLDTPQSRLQLLGDFDGFIEMVTQEFKSEINIQTLSALIFCVDMTKENQDKMIQLIQKHKLKPDSGFFNQLIKQYVKQKDLQAGKEVLSLMNELNVAPDIITFGCLALCYTKSTFEQRQFLQDLKDYNVQPNVQILTTLVHNCQSPKLMVQLLKLAEESQMEVDTKFVQVVERFHAKRQKLIVDYEQGKVQIKNAHLKKSIEEGTSDWLNFCTFYQQWLRRVDIVLPMHPWKQYNTKNIKTVN